MKTMTRLTAVMLTGLSIAGVALAADDGASKPTPPPPGMHGPMHGPMHAHGHEDMLHAQLGGFGMALHKLNLTAQQQQSIKDLVKNAHEQLESQSNPLDFVALNNPGDPNHAQAVRNAQNLATQLIETHSNVDQQIYNLLTPDQKAQLPKVLAEMKAKFEQRREQWREHHTQSSSASSK